MHRLVAAVEEQRHRHYAEPVGRAAHGGADETPIELGFQLPKFTVAFPR